MINDISKMADKCEEEGLPVIAAALREAHETIEYNVKKRLEMQDELTRLHTENQKLRAENERLKGKIVSPDVSTMCYCDNCGAATRWGKHLDIDCETIKSLRDQNIISVTTISGLHEQIGKLRAEVERFQNIFSPDVSIEMLEEGLQARAELQKLRAELEAAKESLDTIFDHIESTIAIMRIAEEASDRLAALKEER